MNRQLIIVVLFLLNWSAISQPVECGTEMTPRQKRALADFHPQALNAAQRTSGTQLQRVAISAHIVTLDDGSRGLTQQQLSDAVANLNGYYSSAGLEFFLAINEEINSSQYYNFVNTEEAAIGLKYDVPNTLNIYFVGNINAGTLCGYAYFPGEGPDRVLMANSCATNGSTLPHEIGHYFSLIHTHGTNNDQLTDELVARTNCTTAGDQLCDTPADPQLSINNVNTSCQYTGTTLDANNDSFVPDPRNIMSYSRKECRDVFTNGQFTRISAAYSQYRTYLYDRMVVAAFDANLTSACTGSPVEFTDESLNATSWNWIFVGGLPATSTAKNPQVSYSATGSYDVTLMIANDLGEQDTLILKDYIQVVPDPTSELISSKTSFEASSIDWKIINPGDDNTFELSSAAFTDGKQSVSLQFFNYSQIGAEDYLVIPLIDNRFSTKYKLSFDHAYTYYDADYFDQLEVVYRPACTADWITVWSKSGADLATAPTSGDAFVPASDQWVTTELNLSIPNDVEYFEVAFKTTNGYGNNLYLDNISLNTTIGIESRDYTCPGASNGEINVQSTGSMTFSYSVDGTNFQPYPNFNSLEAGDYTVIIKDDLGRAYSQDVTINGMSMDIDIGGLSCSGDSYGTATFDITGAGTNDDFYFYLDGNPLSGNVASDLSEGTYRVLVANKTAGCQVEKTFIVESPPALEATVAVTDAACFGEKGTVEVTASGGTSPYQYEIDELGATASSQISVMPGGHMLKITDSNGCELTKGLDVAQPDSLILSYAMDGFTCPNDPKGELSFTGSGGVPPYLFYLDNAIVQSPLSLEDVGDFVLKVVDGGDCSVESAINIDYYYNTPEKPVISLEDGKLMVSSGDAEITWYKDGEKIINATGNTIPYTPGNYQVSLHYADDRCEVFSEMFVVLEANDPLLNEVLVYPNPATNLISLSLPDALQSRFQSMSVYNLSGQLILQTSQTKIDQNWTAGVYIVEISGEGFSRRIKLVRH